MEHTGIVGPGNEMVERSVRQAYKKDRKYGSMLDQVRTTEPLRGLMEVSLLNRLATYFDIDSHLYDRKIRKRVLRKLFEQNLLG